MHACSVKQSVCEAIRLRLWSASTALAQQRQEHSSARSTAAPGAQRLRSTSTTRYKQQVFKAAQREGLSVRGSA